MRFDPLNVKPWVAGVVAGLLFGVAFSVLIAPLDTEVEFWPSGLVAAVIIGLALAGTVGHSVRNFQRRLAPAVQGLSPDEAKAAYRAATRRRSVPADPKIRAAALGIAERQLAGVLKARVFLLIAGGFVVLSQVMIALDDGSHEWWRFWPAAGVVLLIAAQFYQPRQLRRRIARLGDPADGLPE
jgi:hypothetical protein